MLACIAAAGLYGQRFDVASVRPHDPDNQQFVVRMPVRGQFQAEGAPVKLLVMLAYGVQESQIAGGPNWFATEKWDIDAKSDDERHSADETKLMLQHLLEERFALKLHRETRELAVYALTVGKGGPKFRTSDKKSTNIRPGGHSIVMERGGMDVLTGLLAGAAGRPVVDRTGLTGLYDISVVWDDAPVRDAGVPGTKETPGQEAPVGDEHGSVFTAVQEQLGLRLEASRAPVEVIVVDGAERASAN